MARNPDPAIRPIAEKSVNDLEGHTPEPSVFTGLTEKVQRARKVPLGRLSPSDLRLLLSQGQAAQYVFPFAVSVLEQEPWIETDYYPGDLLLTLLEIDRAFWPPGVDWERRVAALIRRAQDTVHMLDEVDRDPEVEGRLRDAAEKQPL